VVDCSVFRSALPFGLRVLLPGAEFREQIVNGREKMGGGTRKTQ